MIMVHAGQVYICHSSQAAGKRIDYYIRQSLLLLLFLSIPILLLLLLLLLSVSEIGRYWSLLNKSIFRLDTERIFTI